MQEFFLHKKLYNRCVPTHSCYLLRLPFLLSPLRGRQEKRKTPLPTWLPLRGGAVTRLCVTEGVLPYFQGSFATHPFRRAFRAPLSPHRGQQDFHLAPPWVERRNFCSTAQWAANCAATGALASATGFGRSLPPKGSWRAKRD